MIHEEYTEGLDMNQFKHIKEISCYNYNFYIGIKGKYNSDLLLGVSDDDNTTEWFIENNQDFKYLGKSYCSDGDKLKRLTEQR